MSALEADQNIPIEQLLQRYNHSALGSSSSVHGVSDMDVDFDTDEGREMEDPEEQDEDRDRENASERKEMEKQGEEEGDEDGERYQGLMHCEADLWLVAHLQQKMRIN